MNPPRSEGYVRMPDAEFEAILTRAAEEGAKRALADVGLDGDEAALDIRDLRSLVDCIRLVRRTAMQTAVRMITTGVMLALGRLYKDQEISAATACGVGARAGIRIGYARATAATPSVARPVGARAGVRIGDARATAASPSVAHRVGSRAGIRISDAGASPCAAPASHRVCIGTHVAVGNAASAPASAAAGGIGIGAHIAISQAGADATGKGSGAAKGPQKKRPAPQTALRFDLVVGQCPALLFRVIGHMKNFHNEIRMATIGLRGALGQARGCAAF